MHVSASRAAIKEKEIKRIIWTEIDGYCKKTQAIKRVTSYFAAELRGIVCVSASADE